MRGLNAESQQEGIARCPLRGFGGAFSICALKWLNGNTEKEKSKTATEKVFTRGSWKRHLKHQYLFSLWLTQNVWKHHSPAMLIAVADCTTVKLRMGWSVYFKLCLQSRQGPPATIRSFLPNFYSLATRTAKNNPSLVSADAIKINLSWSFRMDLYWQVPLTKTDSRNLVKCRVNDEAVAFFDRPAQHESINRERCFSALNDWLIQSGLESNTWQPSKKLDWSEKERTECWVSSGSLRQESHSCTLPSSFTSKREKLHKLRLMHFPPVTSILFVHAGCITESLMPQQMETLYTQRRSAATRG